MAQLEVVIALLRNGACVLKSVLPHSNPLWTPFYGSISYLEAFVIALQGVAALYHLHKGTANVLGGLADRSSLSSWLSVLSATPAPEGESTKRVTRRASQAAADKKQEEREAEDLAAFKEEVERKRGLTVRRVLTGVAQLVVAESFVALASWGLHLKHMSLDRLVWSLTFAEFALAYLLWVTLEDIREVRAGAARARRAATMAVGPPLDAPTAAVVAPQEGLPPWSPPRPPRPAPTRAAAATAARSLRAWREGVPRRRGGAAAAAAEAHALMEFVLLLLNVIAFLGYAALPLTHFVPEESKIPPPYGDYVGWPRWWPGHDDAAWWGNVAGDVAWTIEPALILTTPAIMHAIGRAPKKAKVA